MRIQHSTDSRLWLSGRRSDGELGQQGLWLLWLVATLMLGSGYAFHELVRGDEMDTVGAIAFCIGVVLFLFGLFRVVRREQFRLDPDTRQGTYCTSFWPLGPVPDFEFAFADVKRIEIRFELESPASGRHGASPVYPTWEALAVIKPRRKISLERSRDEALVLELAQKVATLVGAELLDRSPK